MPRVFLSVEGWSDDRLLIVHTALTAPLAVHAAIANAKRVGHDTTVMERTLHVANTIDPKSRAWLLAAIRAEAARRNGAV